LHPNTSTRCGFIGLGSQGAPIARRMIDAGFPTTLWARRSETLEPYRATPATFASTIEEVGAGADHVGICVVNDDDVREVCVRLLPAMRPGSVIAVHSTIHPDTCREVARQAKEQDLHVIDAPVSGGSPAAEAGVLTLMLGGDEDVIARVMPVFESFGKLIVHLGDVGAGQHVKLINNSLLVANLGLAYVALEAGKMLEIDKEKLLELLMASSGRSFALEVLGRMEAPAGFRHGGALLRKDLRLLSELLGDRHDAAAQLAHAADPFLSAASMSVPSVD
jgi:3-hydroxyisobutyrate dehydrogenase